MTATRIKFSDLPKSYSELVAMYPPRPLHDKTDEQNLEELVFAMAGHALTPDQEDYLDLLSDMLLKYQEQQVARPRRRRSPAKRLAYLIEQSGITRSQLATLLGCSQPLVSLILSGKRSLTVPHVRKLAAHFRVDAGYFV
jgi:HTH-type transcriptional regulator/antitoxin HigA